MPSHTFYETFEKAVSARPDAYLQDAKDYTDRLIKAGCVYGDEVVAHTYMPTVYTPEETADFENIARAADRMMRETIGAYLADPLFRTAMGFDPLLEKLIQKEPGYDIPVPITRTDLFYSAVGDFKICEINTDGTSAMLETNLFEREGVQSLWQEELQWPIAWRELIDRYTEVLLSCYAQWTDRSGSLPRVAIVDFPGKMKTEFQAFIKAFEKRGIHCEIRSPEELRYVSGRLLSPSGPIDLVYRRLVTSDLMEDVDRCRPLIDAYLGDAVCLVGSFRTQVPHNKKSFELLHDERFRHHFSAETQRFIRDHVPVTAALTAKSAGIVIEEKNRWVLKPSDRYATKGVLLGIATDETQWLKAVEEGLETGDYLYQEFCSPPQRTLLVAGKKRFSPRAFYSMVGLFTYAGHFAGCLTRVNGIPMIAGNHGGLETASYFETQPGPSFDR